MAQSSTRVSLRYILKGADGKTVASGNSPAIQIEAGSQTEVSGSIDIKTPHLWSIDKPYLYTLEVSVMDGRKELDKETVTTGLRTIRFDNEKGVFLNGQNIKMYGVCLHSDAGAEGNVCPNNDCRIELKVEGAELIVVDNADVLAYHLPCPWLNRSDYSSTLNGAGIFLV